MKEGPGKIIELHSPPHRSKGYNPKQKELILYKEVAKEEEVAEAPQRSHRQVQDKKLVLFLPRAVDNYDQKQ